MNTQHDKQRPSWLDMSRDEFDVEAASDDRPLLALNAGQVPADDACGTGDLLALVELDQTT